MPGPDPLPPPPKLTAPRIALAVLIVGAVIAWWWWRGREDLQGLHERAAGMHGAVLFVALVVLPLVGFPVSILHAAAGAKFGLAWGLVAVGASIALQLLAAYGIVRMAPGFFERRFAWLRRRLPPATHRALTVFVKLLPGAPYVGQIYVLPLAEVPFAIYFWYGLPLHFVRAIIGVIFGEWSGDMTGPRLVAFAAYGVLITLICAWAFRRLLARLRNPPPAGDGRTPAA